MIDAQSPTRINTASMSAARNLPRMRFSSSRLEIGPIRTRWNTSVSIDTDVFHRVRIGPISNLDELNRIRGKLRAADIDAVLIRVGD